MGVSTAQHPGRSRHAQAACGLLELKVPVAALWPPRSPRQSMAGSRTGSVRCRLHRIPARGAMSAAPRPQLTFRGRADGGVGKSRTEPGCGFRGPLHLLINGSVTWSHHCVVASFAYLGNAILPLALARVTGAHGLTREVGRTVSGTCWLRFSPVGTLLHFQLCFTRCGRSGGLWEIRVYDFVMGNSVTDYKR